MHFPTAHRHRFAAGVNGHQDYCLCNHGLDSQQHMFGIYEAIEHIKRAVANKENNLNELMTTTVWMPDRRRAGLT